MNKICPSDKIQSDGHTLKQSLPNLFHFDLKRICHYIGKVPYCLSPGLRRLYSALAPAGTGPYFSRCSRNCYSLYYSGLFLSLYSTCLNQLLYEKLYNNKLISFNFIIFKDLFKLFLAKSNKIILKVNNMLLD